MPLPEIADVVGMDQNARSYAVRHGIIPVESKRGPNGRYLLSRETAVLVLAAAAIAVASGIALIAALVALRNTGAQVSGSSVVIPLGSAA